MIIKNKFVDKNWRFIGANFGYYLNAPWFMYFNHSTQLVYFHKALGFEKSLTEIILENAIYRDKLDLKNKLENKLPEKNSKKDFKKI